MGNRVSFDTAVDATAALVETKTGTAAKRDVFGWGQPRVFFGLQWLRTWLACFVSVFVCGVGVGCVERTPKKKQGRRRRQLTPADKAIIKKNILKKTPAKLSHPVNAKLEDKAVYVGADIDGRVAAGKAIQVTHYWKVKKKMKGWRMFTHVNGPGGKVSFVNVDHLAIGGRYPVTKWKPGEIIRDRQTINIPRNWAHKKLEIYTGIWKPQKGRLKVKGAKTDGHNRILVAALQVGKRYTAGSPAARAEETGEKQKKLKRYVVRKTTKKIEIDGKASEKAWQKTTATERFVDSRKGTRASLRTAAKMLWDEKNLYVYFECADKDIWSTIKKRDGALWTQEVVELMIDHDGDGAAYIEIQVSPNGTLYDAYLPRKRQGQADWQSGVKAKVQVEGTLNKRDDTDKKWSVELALPLQSVTGRAKSEGDVIPKVGAKWRANMFRMDFPKNQPRSAQAWSAPLTGDFHTLDRFGVLVFADTKGQVPEARPNGEKPAEAEKKEATDAEDKQKENKTTRETSKKKSEPAVRESARKPAGKKTSKSAGKTTRKPPRKSRRKAARKTTD
jgi:hypothetical protein